MTYTAAAYVDGFDVQDNLKNTYIPSTSPPTVKCLYR